MAQWITTWAQAHAEMSLLCKNVKDYTARLTVLSQVGGTKLRLRVSNQEGLSDVVLSGASVQWEKEAPILLRFEGSQKLSLKPGEVFCSDAIDLPVSAGDALTVSLAFEGTATSGNILPEAVRYSTKGNFVGSNQMPLARPGLMQKLFQLDPVLPILSAIEVYSVARPQVLVCFGDSITQMSRWTKPLEEELRHSGKSLIILNKGIGGNKLLSDPEGKNSSLYGPAGRKRFQADVLDVSGATALLIALGVNDFNGAKTEREAQGLSEKLKTAYLDLTVKAREAGLRVYAATVTPSAGCKGYQSASEPERQKLNRWLRETDVFDGIVDYDLVVRDSLDPTMMAEICDSGDHIHPGVIGGMKMAKAAYEMLTKKEGTI